jgi:SWIM zinc finger
VIEGSVPEQENARASDQNARAFANRERISEAVEDELAWLREKRPGLVSRIDRASHLLVVHLSDPRSGMIRVRIDAKRRCRFLVRSLTSGGIYVVDPAEAGWSCSCPDYHRRSAPCKHLVATWCLKRAADRGAQRKGCALCINGWVYVGEDLIDSETGEVTTFHNPIRCRRCAGVQSPYLTDEELQTWMASVRWIYAKSMPRHPHQYCLKREQDEEFFERVVKTVWDQGYDRPYLRRPWRSLDVGDHFIWVHTEPKPRMPAPLEDTVLINRALRVQERLV